jgi:phenylpyruvate tautomerase PptA (4-oxalocrotonate tautomerase family)
MPSTSIEVRRQYTRDEEVALIDAVHAALVTAFKIPAADRCVRLVSHEPHRWAVSPKLAQPERYTVVNIDCFAGRTLDAKRALYRTIVENLAPLGIPADHVKIVVRDVPKENWGIRGGKAGSDVELGFKVEV